MEPTIFAAFGAVMVALQKHRPWLTAIGVTCGVAIGTYLATVI